MPPQMFLPLTPVSLRRVQRAQDAERRDVGKALLERNLLCHISPAKLMAIEKVQPSTW